MKELVNWYILTYAPENNFFVKAQIWYVILPQEHYALIYCFSSLSIFICFVFLVEGDFLKIELSGWKSDMDPFLLTLKWFSVFKLGFKSFHFSVSFSQDYYAQVVSMSIWLFVWRFFQNVVSSKFQSRRTFFLTITKTEIYLWFTRLTFWNCLDVQKGLNTVIRRDNNVNQILLTRLCGSLDFIIFVKLRKTTARPRAVGISSQVPWVIDWRKIIDSMKYSS